MGPRPISGIRVFSVEIFQCLPSRLYGGSPCQISRMWPMASANISLRSMPRMPSAWRPTPAPGCRNETAFKQVIHHGLRGGQHRVCMRQVRCSSAKLDLFGVRNQARLKQHRVGDARRHRSGVRRHRLRNTPTCRRGLRGLLADIPCNSVKTVHRHGEKSIFMVLLPLLR